MVRLGEEVYENPENRKNFAEICKEMQQTFENGQYKIELIRRTINENKRLRRTYGVLMLVNPARLGEIQAKVFVTKNTIYKHLYDLIELGLVKKIAIMDLWNRKKLGVEEREIMKKFKDWVKTMADGQIRYFAAKTNYFVLTDLGKDSTIASWALKLEKEQKSNEI